VKEGEGETKKVEKGDLRYTKAEIFQVLHGTVQHDCCKSRNVVTVATQPARQ